MAQSVEEHVGRYLECARAAVQSTDDAVSDASTIAVGLHAQCRIAFVDVGLNLDRQNNLAEVLRPTLVQFILKSRIARSKSPPSKAPTL